MPVASSLSHISELLTQKYGDRGQAAAERLGLAKAGAVTWLDVGGGSGVYSAVWLGLNPKAQQQMMANKMAVELVPQGTLVERIRAGGSGLGGVLTPTGVGTVVEEGKAQLEVDGKKYLVETALHADFALIHAFLADYLGNLSYALTARNFNPVMAMAAETVIATAENIVPVGLIAPDHVVTPAPLVDYLVTQG